MRGYANTKPHPFQYGVPLHKYPRSREDQGDFGDNFYKMLCSWVNFRDFISIGSIAEVDKIRNVFTAMFQADQKQVVKKHKKGKFRETSHIVKIDLDKIDENLNLSNKEKRRLRHILNQIKYREVGKQSNKRETKRVKERSVVFRKTKKKIALTEKNLGRTRRAQSIEKPKERSNWQRSESKHCQICSEEDQSHRKSNQRRCANTATTPSEERIFKTLMNLDRSCCGDSFKTLFDPKGKRTFITQNQNINIENLELKYIQPTCLVQYTGMKRKVSIDVLSQCGSGIFPKESFSPSALKAITEQFNDDVRNSHQVDITESKPAYMNEANNIFERVRSTCHHNNQGDISEEFYLQEHTHSLKSHQDEIAKRYSEGSETLLDSGDQLMPPYNDFEELDNKRTTFRNKMEYPSENDKPKKNTSKYRKLKNFVKKCLCFRGTDEDRDTNLSKHRRKGRNVNARLRKRFNSPDAKTIHLTEQEYVDRKKEINK